MGFFSRDKKEGNDVKSLRDAILYFIRQRLSSAEGGEGTHIRGIHLYFNCTEATRPDYEAAVFYGDEARFKREIQRIADDYAIGLPAVWVLEMVFTDVVPAEAEPIAGVQGSIWVSTSGKATPATTTGIIRVLQGEAEHNEYILQPDAGIINIGREKQVRSADGFMRINHICFPAGSSHEANKFISRQHAHIVYDQESGQFLLFADEGGIPPNNKVKVRRKDAATPVKLQSRQVPHSLQDGDQVMLGDGALIEFITAK